MDLDELWKQVQDMDEQLGQVEDNAWGAKSRAAGLDFVLGNLLLELQRANVIDVPAFIGRLRQACTVIPAMPDRTGAEAILDRMLVVLGEGTEVPPDAVFH